VKINYEEIHNLLIIKSSKIEEVKNQIIKNGVIKINKQKIDLFCFITKTIVSQQISDNVAKLIWNKFCSYFKNDKPSLKKIPNINFLENILLNIGISKRKIAYITNFYNISKSNSFIEEALKNKSESDFRDQLKKNPGIGRWTCDMTLIFFFQQLNIHPKNDLVIEKVKKRLCEIENKEINFDIIFSPYLSILSLHLWKMSKRVLK
jgi:DNA-3-methyladenine glycosylase II